MRHGKKFNHLGRKVGHRKALLRNMASSLILHKRITTTLAKAKEIRKYVEPIITKSKATGDINAPRIAFRYLQDKAAVKELFTEVSGRVSERNGGYTRIIKLGNRLGDNAEMAMIELVDFNELYSQNKASSTGTKKRRRRRGGGKSAESTQSVPTSEAAETIEPIEETVIEAPTEEVVEGNETETQNAENAETVAEEVESPEIEVDEATVADVVDEVSNEADSAEEASGEESDDKKEE